MLIKFSEKEMKLKTKREKETSQNTAISEIQDAPHIVSKTKSSQITKDNIGILMMTMVPEFHNNPHNSFCLILITTFMNYYLSYIMIIPF